MDAPPHDPPFEPEPDAPRIQRGWRLFAGSIVLLGAVLALRLVAGGWRLSDWLPVLLLALVGVAALGDRHASQALESRRRDEAESLARLVRGLSRSISPDAIVGAIAGELASVVGADHVVVVRRRLEPARLDATLVSTRPGIPDSTTSLPLSDLEARPDGERRRAQRPIAGPDRRRGIIAVAREDLATAALASRPSLRGRVATTTEPPIDPPWAPRPARDLIRSRLAAAPAMARRRLDPERARPVPAGAAPVPAGAVPVPAGAASLPAGAARVPGGDTSTRPDGVLHGPASRVPDPDAAQAVADRIADRVRGVYALRHTLAAPMIVGGEVVGALVLSRRQAADWPPSSQRLLDGAAVEASVALARAYSYREAQERASTDGLTGLPNRRYFDEFCGLLARRRRSGDAIGVMMVDIDHFKRLNDRFGHATGDAVLQAVAAAIAGAVREADVPARYGGEEFAVLLRNPSHDVAVEIGERTRAAVAGLDLRVHGVDAVSVSVGVAVQAAPDQPIAELIEQADRALYRAKEAGRDRVVAA